MNTYFAHFMQLVVDLITDLFDFFLYMMALLVMLQAIRRFLNGEMG